MQPTDQLLESLIRQKKSQDTGLPPDEPDISKFLFDRRDYELIRIVNQVDSRDRNLAYTRWQYYGYFHPHGIKEMAESRSLRIAYAMVRLLSSLEMGGMEDRLNALRSLKSEVLDTAEGPMPKNTARILMQIMKEVVRTKGDVRRQLELAHDFRVTVAGKPRMVRKQLRTYHLIEMPEDWNQVAFDDHVHDANTKGRKSTTHLIMDAWIKGIRRLRIIHYNYIEPRFATELLEAARIMDIDIRIGIEFTARFRDRYVNLIWVPRGFPDAQAFLCFLEEPQVATLMAAGREVSKYQQAYVSRLLLAFNRSHLPVIEEQLGIQITAPDEAELTSFVGMGQKSTLHLEKLIHQKLLAALHAKAEELRSTYGAAASEEQKAIKAWFERMNHLDIEALVADHLKPENNPDCGDPGKPDLPENVPELLRLSPRDLLTRLTTLQTGYRITLNLSGLAVEDVLELLYDSDGMISRLELFNLKDWAAKKTAKIPAISRLMEALNEHSPIALKRLILGIIQDLEASGKPENQDQIQKLYTILHDIVSLQTMYKARPLKARIGSDSTGRSPRVHGMGMVIMETLPGRAQEQIRREKNVSREILPIRIDVNKRITYIHRVKATDRSHMIQRVADAISKFSGWGYRRIQKWKVVGDSTRMTHAGNVVTLGGVLDSVSNGLELFPESRRESASKFPLGYFNSHFRNTLKVIIGFIPAFATFALTKDWWLLAYFGAFIWFGITGLRNIVQSVLGGGGLRRSPLLRWNAYVSWDRISDSLLYTGFSVPLLDYLVKTLLLDRLLGITTAQPVLLYSVMALANGIYLCSHNLFRGLQKGAAFANIFRSVLSIPIAVVLNAALSMLLGSFGVQASNLVLQKWAAVISKAASDIMAGIIEGTADRITNIRTRYKEYHQLLASLLDIHARLELLFPEERDVNMLERVKAQCRSLHGEGEARDLERIIFIHALDGLYFWNYQPRARSALKYLMNAIDEEERHIWVTSQFTLLRQRDISQMFIDGVLGQDFARALSFYLSHHLDYLEDMKRFV